jgi:hypothetical protein
LLSKQPLGFLDNEETHGSFFSGPSNIAGSGKLSIIFLLAEASDGLGGAAQ